ncbi:BGTF surface domain-containing protein [Halorientalis pallida]|uniref:DUF7827 domain-containing protein n=1 Tax=Halorientalis pallida TaxID=2479928 RepID=A0A498KZC7_9EURY|nr:BGTF surface domain-containing protein [Halorientalis pallida]RXK51378.1 hypothetical protein EAF64_01690 [Halorientalis pallida]
MHSLAFQNAGPSTVSRQAVVFGVVVLIAVAALPATGVTVAATSGTESTAEAPVDQSETDGGSTGDTIEIDVSVPDGASGRLYLGSEEKAYLTSVAFTDGGDGDVTLSWNTFLAGGHLGNETRAWSADSGRVTDVTRYTAPLSDPLEPAIYDANLTVRGSERVVTPIALRPASVDNLTVAVAPASDFGDDPADLSSSRTGRMAVGDTLVATIDTSGVLGMLSAQPGDTPTARFRSLVTGRNASLEIRPGRTDADLALDRSFENDAFDVAADASTGRLTVAMDTSALRYEGNANRLEAGESYTVVFVIESESGLTIEEAALADEIRVVDRSATFETGANGTLRLPSSPDAGLSGSTTLAPRTELEVEARAAGTFLQRNETSVSENGTFTTSLDLSAVDPGTAFTASIDGLDAEIPGVVTNASGRDADTERANTTVQPNETETAEPRSTAGVDGLNAAGQQGSSTVEPAETTRAAVTTEESGPGFGAVAALWALVAGTAVLLVRWRTA